MARSDVAPLDGPELDRERIAPPLRFDEWWIDRVLVDSHQEWLSPKALVLAVANRDGGGHVDRRLDDAYTQLSRHNSFGWVTTGGRRGPR